MISNKGSAAKKLFGLMSLESRKIDGHRLGKSGEIRNDKDGLALMAPEKGEHLGVGRMEELNRAVRERTEGDAAPQ